MRRLHWIAVERHLDTQLERLIRIETIRLHLAVRQLGQRAHQLRTLVRRRRRCDRMVAGARVVEARVVGRGV